MTYDDYMGMLAASRINLGQITTTIRGLIAHDPELAKPFIPKLRILEANQVRLEGLWENASNLGYIQLIILAASALAGLGLWTWKHHEATSLERERVEGFKSCVEERTRGGASREEAEATCDRLYKISEPGGGTIADISGLIKTTTVGAIAVLGFYYLVIKRK